MGRTHGRLGFAMTRQEQEKQFIATAGWADAEIIPLAGDASNRRYDRLTHPIHGRAVLMDADPGKGEDVRPFVTIAQFLRAQGLSAPEIFCADPTSGFLIIEDLGDRLFAREMQSDPALEQPLYEAAVDVLGHLHKTTPPALSRYDAMTTVPLAALAYDWYQSGVAGQTNNDEKAAFNSAMSAALLPYDLSLGVLIQRDYHAENLLWLPERDGVAKVGLLDFQDAMIGHPVYDLVSILQDARRNVSDEMEELMKERFFAQSNMKVGDFATSYAVFGAQRSLRILGVFARLCMRDAKPHYVDLIPRVWRHLQSNLAHPNLSDLAKLVNRHLPAPDEAALNLLKEQSGKCSIP